MTVQRGPQLFGRHGRQTKLRHHRLDVRGILSKDDQGLVIGQREGEHDISMRLMSTGRGTGSLRRRTVGVDEGEELG